MKRLLSDTNQVTTNSAVNNPLLGDDVEVPVHLEYPDPRGNYDGLLAGPVQVPVDEMFLEGVEGNVENLQEVSLRGSGESGPGRGHPRPCVVVHHELIVTVMKCLQPFTSYLIVLNERLS